MARKRSLEFYEMIRSRMDFNRREAEERGDSEEAAGYGEFVADLDHFMACMRDLGLREAEWVPRAEA